MNPEAVETSYFRNLLRDELEHRIKKNPRYSLRSFADALGTQSGALSLILSGKRSISTKLTDRIFKALELSPAQQKKFIESVMSEKKNLKRVSPRLRTKLIEVSKKRASSSSIDQRLGIDEFRVISDWYHAAILELTYSKHFKPDPHWIARTLGISAVEAKLAIERLLKLELLEEKNGTLVKTNFFLDTVDKTKTSVFHKKRIKQVLEKSAYSLENDPIDERNHSGITLCIAPEKLSEAKERIQAFLWDLTRTLTSGEQERLYELHVSLFPTQKSDQKSRRNFV